MPNSPKAFRVNQQTKAFKPTYKRKQYDKERGNSAQRGYDADWERLREWYLQQPENVFCACGCGEPSEMVDHIEPIQGKEDPKRLDIRNLQGMTKRCNTRKAIRFEGGFGHKPDTSEDGKRLIQGMKDQAAKRADKIEARGMV